MKKLITLVVAAVISVTAFAQNLPAFTEAENAYVFDAKKLDEDFGDGCKIVNLSFEENLSFDVYVMKSNKKKWILAGSGTVSGVMDDCEIEQQMDGDFDDYRYFALVPKTKKDYQIQFTYDSVFMYAFSKEVCVFLIDVADSEVPAKIKSNSTIIDVDSVKGKFKDNIKLVNKSSDSNMDFLIFGYDEEGAKWNVVGKSHLKEFDDIDSIDTPINDSSNSKKYKFYAVYAKNGKKYDVNPSKARNDLIIEIK